MALINIDNSKSIYGRVRSVSLRDSGGMSLVMYEPGEMTPERAAYLTLSYGAGKASNIATGQIATTIYDLTMGDWELYHLQRALNEDAWGEVRLQATVEFAPTWGDGSLGSHLLLRTTWQEV